MREELIDLKLLLPVYKLYLIKSAETNIVVNMFYVLSKNNK